MNGTEKFLLNFTSVTIVGGYDPVLSNNRCSNMSIVPGVYALPVEKRVRNVRAQSDGNLTPRKLFCLPLGKANVIFETT